MCVCVCVYIYIPSISSIAHLLGITCIFYYKEAY